MRPQELYDRPDPFPIGLCRNHRSVYICPDAVPPIHVVSYHVATDKVPAQNGDKFRSILATVYNQSQLAERKHVARYWSINTAATGVPLSAHPSVSYYNEISGGHIGRAVVWRGCSAGPVLPLW